MSRVNEQQRYVYSHTCPVCYTITPLDANPAKSEAALLVHITEHTVEELAKYVLAVATMQTFRIVEETAVITPR